MKSSWTRTASEGLHFWNILAIQQMSAELQGYINNSSCLKLASVKEDRSQSLICHAVLRNDTQAAFPRDDPLNLLWFTPYSVLLVYQYKLTKLL